MTTTNFTTQDIAVRCGVRPSVDDFAGMNEDQKIAWMDAIEKYDTEQAARIACMIVNPSMINTCMEQAYGKDWQEMMAIMKGAK